jgi:hypothetical protein
MATQDQSKFFGELLKGQGTDDIDDLIREYAALGLGRIGGDSSAHALEAKSSNQSPRVRFAIAVALGNTRSPIAVPLLIQMYTDTHPDVSYEVCGALRTLTHLNWCDGSDVSTSARQARWQSWWKANAARTVLYGTDDCPKLNAELPTVP